MKFKNIKIIGFRKEYDFKYFGVFIAALPMILVSGLRYNIGTDYRSYSVYYRLIGQGNRTHIDYLYYLINLFCNKHAVSYETLIFILSLFFVLVCFVVCRNESPYPALSVFLLFGMGYYFASFNIMREMLGIAILLMSTKYCYERKPIPFLILVIIASGLHLSCILFLVIYFIPEIQITPRKIALLSVIIILLSPFVNPILRYFATFTKYSKHLGGRLDNGSTGFINLTLQFLILFFVSFFRDDSKKFQVYFNSQFITACLGLMSSIPLIRRIQYIFGMPSIILVAMAISNMKNKLSRIMSIALFSIVFMVYCILITNAGYHGVLPYTSIFDR